MNKKIIHPGFILFEGLDFTGKSSIAQELTKEIQKKIEIDLIYSTNKGFLVKDVISKNVLKNLTPERKANFILEAYSKEKFPDESMDFRTIIQDRYFPSILFYSQIRAKQNLLNDPRIKSCLKPKHVFLIESDFESKRKRALERNSFTLLEEKILYSEKDHNLFQEEYRRIIKSLKIPYSIVDSTFLNQKKSSNICLDFLIENNTLTQPIDLHQLSVDFEPKVYFSTAKMKKGKLIAGEKLSPLNVERRYDSENNVRDILIDGRHRAYAALEAGFFKFPGYIKYKKVNNLDLNGLTKIKDFKFK